MSSNKPIGIFDSGVGGTSIWKEIHQLLPNEHTIYLADSKNAPYGNRSREEIVALSVKNTERLLALGAKIIVVACNTATTNAIHILRKKYAVPFVGIEPAIKPAALHSKSKKIGILATKGTLSSELFASTAETYSKETEVIEIVGTGLVEAIEQGEKDSLEVKEMLTKLLRPFLEAKIDYLVLGCSHYPYLLPSIKEIIPKDILIIDSGEAAAKQTKKLLEQAELLATIKQNKPEFYSNGNITVLSNLVKAEENNFPVHFLDF